MFLSLLVTILEKIGLALLGTFFQTTAQSAKDAGLDPTVLDYIYQLVDSAQKNASLDTPEKEYDWVFGQAVSYLKTRGLDIAITLLDSVVSLAIHHYNTNTQRQVRTIASLPAGAAS